MPRLLLFLETSARPLAYALKPVIEQVAADKGVPPPLLQFVKCFQSGAGTSSQTGLAVRIQQIFDGLKLGDTDRVLVTDEYAATGGSLKNVIEIIEAYYPGQPITAYALAAEPAYEESILHLDDEGKKTSAYHYEPQAKAYRPNIDPDDSAHRHANVEYVLGAIVPPTSDALGYGGGFEYRHSMEYATGVQKFKDHEPLVKAASHLSDHDRERMRRLRMEMYELGKEVVRSRAEMKEEGGLRAF